jgi:hypothetical protein
MSEKNRDMLTICDLRRVYPSRGRIPSRVAVNDLCLGVPAGQCFGLLGPNGAGKTTTMKMLTGDDAPQGGDAWINNRSVRNSLSEVYKVMGYCPQFDQVCTTLWRVHTRARTRAHPRTHVHTHAHPRTFTRRWATTRPTRLAPDAGGPSPRIPDAPAHKPRSLHALLRSLATHACTRGGEFRHCEYCEYGAI